MKQPVDCVHVTCCGFGERAGNASLEQIAVILEKKLKRKTLIDLSKLRELSHFVQSVFLTPVHPHAPIVGSKVFLHESGIHQKGILFESSTYQFLNPEDFGAETGLVLGKHSGRRMRALIAEESGCTEEEVEELQRLLVNKGKAELESSFVEAISVIRKRAFVGLTQKAAVELLSRREGSSDIN
jgi:homocitrate synthase NifV